VPVIGCSLNRNDWQLVSLLYTTQKLNTNSREYQIELVNFHSICREIKDNYPYLSFRSISEIPEVREFITRSLGVTSEDKKSAAVEEYLNDEQRNIFDVWLRSKGESLQDRGILINTQAKTFENYIKERVSNENKT
jgi:hypothetical protein